ncbi:MAG: hypothetical protein ABIB71_04445 [Candidatus Woesearchaeota archaeon]
MKKGWSKKNPAYGQCHCTALVVNDYFGGRILKYSFEDGSGHYSNYIEEKEIDLTRSQFDKNEKFSKPKIIRREGTKNTKEYFLLKKRVKEFLRKR